MDSQLQAQQYVAMNYLHGVLRLARIGIVVTVYIVLYDAILISFLKADDVLTVFFLCCKGLVSY